MEELQLRLLWGMMGKVCLKCKEMQKMEADPLAELRWVFSSLFRQWES